jgi:uncharacterized membrane protein
MLKPTANKLDRLVVILLLLFGVSVRFIRFGQLPPGLYHDEAQNGLDALSILQGDYPLYFAENNGREPLFIYLVALSIDIFGRSPFAVRLPSFFIGFLTLAATYNLAQVLFDRKTARYALAVLAATFWHIHLSRVAFRASLLPLFTALYLSMIVKAVRYQNPRQWLFSGVLYGFSWYTYIAARFTPIAIGVAFIYAACTRRKWLNIINSKQLIYAITLFTSSALLILLPLGIFTLIHPEIVLSRSGQVSIFNEQINGGNLTKTFIRHALNTAGMFFVKGDRIWRHNLSYRPVWTAGLSTVFIIGLGVALSDFWKRPAVAIILVWTSVMLLPTMLAEDAPHFLRAVGILPTAALLPAIGLSWLQERLKSWLYAKDASSIKSFYKVVAAYGIPWLLVVSSGLISTYSYFVSYAKSPMVYHWFESGPMEIGQIINALSGQGWNGNSILSRNTENKTVCIDPILWQSWTSIPFLVPKENICFLPNVHIQHDKGITFVVWPYNDWRQAINPYIPHPSYLSIQTGPSAQGDLDPEPYTIAQFLHADPLPPVPPTIAQFRNGLELHAVLVEQQISGVMVHIWWSITQKQSVPSTVFVHYMRDGNRIAQNDGQPGNDQLPTTIWTPGDLVLDQHLIKDVTIDNINDKLRIGLYQSDNGVNIPRIDDGQQAESWYETALILKQ